MFLEQGIKKISIIGAGTAGAMSVAHFKHFSNFEVDWYYDSTIIPQSVGEGTTVSFTNWLDTVGIKNLEAIQKLDATTKIGIMKEGWNREDFMHNFSLGFRGMHLNASNFQKMVRDKYKGKVKIYDKNVTHDCIDSSYIIDCSGFSNDEDKFFLSECTPVNSACTFSTSWEYPKFNYTRAIAMKFGWCFVIPLIDKCSFGYLYNSSYISKEQACEELNELVSRENFKFSQKRVKYLNFKNYYRKVNFEERVMYNGNSSFFLEPMEATSLTTVEQSLRKFYDYIHNNLSLQQVNDNFITEMKDLELMIACHYLTSPYNNNFWKSTKEKAKEVIGNLLNETRIEALKYKLVNELGSWPSYSWQENIKGLGIEQEIEKLIRINN